jgi:hypothetical protein
MLLAACMQHPPEQQSKKFLRNKEKLKKKNVSNGSNGSN